MTMLIRHLSKRSNGMKRRNAKKGFSDYENIQ